MKRKELEEFKKRWEENLGGLGEMLNSPWFAVSIKYDEAEKNKCCIKLGQYVLRYWAQLHGVDLSPYGDKEITTDEFKQAVTKAQTEMKTDFEGGEGNAENNILDQLKRGLNIILFGTTKPEEDQKIKLGKNDLLSASNVVFFDELLKTDVGDLKTIIDDREIGNITGAQKKHVHIEYEEHNKRKKQEIELDDYYKEMIVRGLRSLEKNEWIKTSLKRTAQSRLDSLYPPETPDEVEEDSYLTECGGYILLYLKKILKVDESRLQEAANNDVILAEFGKSWINSGVEKLLIKERLNEGSIERLQHAIKSHKILLSTVSDPDILRRAEDAMDESEKTLDECMKTRCDLDKEFNRKDLELKAAFNRLTEPDTRKLASENNTNSANIVKATATKQSNNSQTVTIAQPAAVKPSEKQEKGVACGNRGKENKDGAKFCRYCGTPLVAKSIRFCTECGHKIRPGGKFCPACGTKVED